MKTLLKVIAFIFIGLIIFKCAKDVPDPITKDPTNKTLTTRAVGDTTYRPLEYGSTLKVYPNTISKCWNRKKARYEWQAALYGDQLLPACKHQQFKEHDIIVVSDTAEIFYTDLFYIAARKIN